MDMLRLFFRRFFENVAACFRGRNLLWQIVAMALTYLLVTTGSDEWYFISTRSQALFSIAIAAAALGFFAPIMISLGAYGVGKMRRDMQLMRAGAAVGQASVMALLLSSFYKIFTGRPHPELFSSAPTADISHQFNFGIFRDGIFWGWPSSHTAVAFAGALALIALYPQNKLIRSAALVYALYIGLGVSVTIHWFSDFVAGAIMGAVVGVVVGKSFRD